MSLQLKRITRRPQRYECDTYSTLSRKQDILAQRRAASLVGEPKINKNITRCSSSSLADNANNSQSTTHKVIQKNTKKVSKPRNNTRKSSKNLAHGAKCWNFCDCVLIEMLRAQPFVELCERKGKRIQFTINPDEAVNLSSTKEKQTKTKKRKTHDSTDGSSTEC
ncbi:hypothetical protein DICVIV_09144 [Dictyocaulus viviparus]|uniref:Uncharacterized protein n=1 Tax=Dictyocaulus viviparus TaxID=29172 RepID=A0A0D8XJR9_DICVI|nr:hypothetical protein DICVIV_09144 [Dictyocaulus viviparus]